MRRNYFMKSIYKLMILSVFLSLILFTSCGEKSVNHIIVKLDNAYNFIKENNNGSSISYVYYYNSSSGNSNNIITLHAECYDNQMAKVENKNITWKITNSLGETFNIAPSASSLTNYLAVCNGEYLNVFLSNINTLATYTFTAYYDDIKSFLSIDVDTKGAIIPHIEIEHSSSNTSFKKSVNILTPTNIKLFKGHTYKLSLSNDDTEFPYGNLKWIITDDEGTATFNTKVDSNNFTSKNNIFKNSKDVYINLPAESNKKINIKVKAGDKREYSFNIITVTPNVDETIDCPSFYTEEINNGYKVTISVSKTELNKQRVCEIERNNSGIWQEVELENGRYEFNLTPNLDKNEPILFEYKARLRDEKNEVVGTYSYIKLKINPTPLYVKISEEKFNIASPSKNLNDFEWQKFPSSQLLKKITINVDSEQIKMENEYQEKFKDSVLTITGENCEPVLDNSNENIILGDDFQINNISLEIPIFNPPSYKYINASISPVKGYAKRLPEINYDKYDISNITYIPLFTRLEFSHPVFESDNLGYYQIRIHNKEHSAIRNNNWICVLTINNDIYKTILPSQMRKDNNDYIFTITDISNNPLPLVINSTNDKIRTMLVPLNNIDSQITYVPVTGMGNKLFYTTNDVKIAPIPSIDTSDEIQLYANKRIGLIKFDKNISLNSYNIMWTLSDVLVEDVNYLSFSHLALSENKAEIVISEKQVYNGYLYIKVAKTDNSLDDYYSPYIHINKVSLSQNPSCSISNLKSTNSTNYDNGYQLSTWSTTADVTFPTDILELIESSDTTYSEGHNGGGGSSSYTKASDWVFKNKGTYSLSLQGGTSGIGGRDSGYSYNKKIFVVSRKKGYIDRAYYINSNGKLIDSESFSYLKKLTSGFGFKTYTGNNLWNI